MVDYPFDYWLMFEELEYNHHWHIEVLYDHCYPRQMDQHQTETKNRRLSIDEFNDELPREEVVKW
jgi:hypothetical protein